ncbi:hypothetical protein QMQ05_08730 [Glutamicibacter ectropisis]|uniref:Uncharacterized protein n=1 Tax=Glutamicibacter ectropisis TaxID=3046593 RepID=A0AAU6W9A5_9MICC
MTGILKITVACIIGASAISGCSPSMSTSSEGDTSESVALLGEFFKHLEAGETSAAAALTDIDFPEEFLDTDFYKASAAIPSDAKVIQAEGNDDSVVDATVEFVLDDPKHPQTATFKVKDSDGHRVVTGWGEKFSIINAASPGRIIVNGELEYAMKHSDGHDLLLLPALYNISYEDPTGMTQLSTDGTNEFDMPWPFDQSGAYEVPANISISPGALSVSAQVETESIADVDAQIDALTDACVKENLSGPSCPDNIPEKPRVLNDSSSVQWFELPGYGLSTSDGRVEYSKGFTVEADGLAYAKSAVYSGTLTKDSDGKIVFTR